MIVTTEGIVLSAAENGEADLIAHVLTETHGVQQLLFRGIRKSRRRSRSAAEPGMRSTFVFRMTNSRIHTVSECTPLDLREEIRSRYGRIISMHFLLEAVLRTAGQGQPDGFLYKMLRGAIESLEKDTGTLALPLFFIIRLLIHLGIFPAAPACSRCGVSDRALGFSFEDHTLLCSGCALRKGDIVFQPHEVSFLATAARSRYAQMPRLVLSPDETAAMLSAFVRFTEHSFRVSIKSARLLTAEEESS